MTSTTIIGTEGPLGAAIARHLAGEGHEVRGIAVGGLEDSDAVAPRGDDLLIFADNFVSPVTGIANTGRGDLEKGLERLVWLPFRLALRLQPALNPTAKIVLLTRDFAGMTRSDDKGRYAERPFRAAQHQLFKSLAVDWKEASLSCHLIALSESEAAGEDAAAIVAAITTLAAASGELPFTDLNGAALGW